MVSPNNKAKVSNRYKGDEYYGKVKRNLMNTFAQIPPPPPVGVKRKRSDD